jgi:hypothetical protein
MGLKLNFTENIKVFEWFSVSSRLRKKWGPNEERVWV